MKKLTIAMTAVLALLFVGAMTLHAEEGKRKGGGDAKKSETPVAKSDSAAAKASADQIAEIQKNIDDAKQAVNDGKKDAALSKLSAAADLLKKLKDSLTATPAPAVAASSGESFTGTVSATMLRHQQRLSAGGVSYDLMLSDKADAAAKDIMDKIAKGEATGTYTVKGTKSTINGRDGILVDSITKAN